MVNERKLFRMAYIRQELYTLYNKHTALQERTQGKAVAIDNIHGSGTSDTVGDLATSIADNETRYNKLLQEYNEIRADIDLIPDKKAKEIIYLKYADGYSVKQICAALKISRQTVRRKLIKYVK